MSVPAPLGNRKLIVLLVALSAFGPLSMSIYTPSMTTIGHALMASDEDVKLTLTTFLIGFSAGQLFYGPLSDRFGRKPVLLIGVAIYTLAGLACAFAASIDTLILLRLFHGLGVCSGSVVSRAVTRDIFGATGSARVMAFVSLGINVAPALAPIIGGYLTALFGWQAIFLVLAAFGAIIFVVVAFGLRESNPYLGQSAGILGTVRQAGPMLVHARFLGFALAISSIFAAMFAYIVGSPFVLMNKLGLSPAEYGYWLLTSVAAFTTGSFIATRTVSLLPLPRCILLGLSVAIVGAIAMLGLALSGVFSVGAIIWPYVLVALGCGMTMAPAMAGSVNQFPRQAGTASSIMGTLQMGAAAASTAVVTAFTDGSQLPMIWTLAGCLLFGLATTILLLRPFRADPPVDAGGATVAMPPLPVTRAES